MRACKRETIISVYPFFAKKQKEKGKKKYGANKIKGKRGNRMEVNVPAKKFPKNMGFCSGFKFVNKFIPFIT